jgi:hypothetical protein
VQDSGFTFDERTQAGFEFAREVSVQLVTLSAGFLALTITFAKEVLAGLPPRGAAWLRGTWILHVLSILAGVLTLLALTGVLMPVISAGESPLPPKFTPTVRWLAGIQIFFFFAAMATLAVYAAVGQLRSFGGKRK